MAILERGRGRGGMLIRLIAALCLLYHFSVAVAVNPAACFVATRGGLAAAKRAACAPLISSMAFLFFGAL